MGNSAGRHLPSPEEVAYENEFARETEIIRAVEAESAVDHAKANHRRLKNGDIKCYVYLWLCMYGGDTEQLAERMRESPCVQREVALKRDAIEALVEQRGWAVVRWPTPLRVNGENGEPHSDLALCGSIVVRPQPLDAQADDDV